jgi:F-type H+-transporting ATPase subunit alpha
MPVEKQVMILYAAISGYLDDIAVENVRDFEVNFQRFMESSHPEIGSAIARDKILSEETEEVLKAAIEEFKKTQFAA